MAKLNGIVIADPSKRGMGFRNLDHFNIERKQPGKPQGRFVSEQDRLNNFPRRTPVCFPPFTSVIEDTIPMSETLNNEMLDLWRTRRKNLKGNVEEPQLEADKKVSKHAVDAHESVNQLNTTGMSFGSHYNPQRIYRLPTFKEDIRINMRYVRSVASRLANAKKLAEQAHYLYVEGTKSYQKYYYSANPWKDSRTGRVHLFERPFTRNFA